MHCRCPRAANHIADTLYRAERYTADSAFDHRGSEQEEGLGHPCHLIEAGNGVLWRGEQQAGSHRPCRLRASSFVQRQGGKAQQCRKQAEKAPPFHCGPECRTSAIRAERLGSYSMRSIRLSTPALREKSMMRYSRFAPPPLCHTLMRPLLARPPVFRRPTVSGLKGAPFQRCDRSTVMRPRCPGDVGFHTLSSASPRAHGLEHECFGTLLGLMW